ncbi:DUF2971 domain-containing protein [Serratia marcescens]|uniref:DUF2971 domain-containing protein n=1 Tax=Serratia marcescens TaxID=615 RepID=UPI00217BBAA1|nr:DUF2971 domain-containing protein [Serratia marcescens]MBN5343823.1 DUF2971 domain-containing protein [Serratia marcescens]CAI1577226.1 Protein of uncharacterised function (DUF2971) [Serratia marcescens]CAI2029169.1 Protein of uncharacterised function (DUF2971) [Serratia marcescens]CAI2157388.1 Protein of uncharacterised function (DUF2971) [Serratia marcescens]
MEIFKYFHSDRMDVLRNKSIRLTQPLALNDPFELKPHISAIASDGMITAEIDRVMKERAAVEYRKLPKDVRRKFTIECFEAVLKSKIESFSPHRMMSSITPGISDMLLDKFETMIGILCVSTSPDNLLMWAHYADSHKGFVIEFDSDSDFFKQKRSDVDEFGFLREVKYQKVRPSVVLTDIKDFTIFLTKGIEWSYEKEWRMMLPIDNADTVVNLGSGTPSVNLFNFPSTAVKSIIMGCRMDEEKKEEIRRCVEYDEDYNHVKLLNTKIDNKEYRLVIESD